MNMKIRIYEKLKSKIKNQSGMTLVELIVVFALVGIFMVAATFMLSTSMQLFSRMQATSHAVTVSDLILDKIVGEIVAADIPKKGKPGYYFWLESDAGSPWIAFCNRSGSPISIYADNDTDATKGFGQGQLFMKYYKMSEEDKKKLNEINWHFDQQVYMNYEISDLKFSRPEPEAHPNVVKIDLTLTNKKTGFAYSTVRYAENYNFDFSTNYMCVRNNEGSGMPKEAIEFKIDEVTNPDNPGPEIIEYTVYYRDAADATGPDLLKPTTGQTTAGTSVLVDAPIISGYKYNSEKSENPKTIDALKKTIHLFYEKVSDGKFTVYYINKKTGVELNKKVYADKKIGDKIPLDAPYIAGYNTPVPNWIEVTYTESNHEHRFYYEPKQWTYTIRYCPRGGGADVKLPDTGQIFTDESIHVTSPKIVGYAPEKEEQTFTAIGDNTGGNQFIVYYTTNQIPLTIRYQYGSLEIKEPMVVSMPYNTSGYSISVPNIDGYQQTLYSANVSFHINDSHFNAETESMEYIFYYTRKPANHPYTTVGPNVKVQVEPGEVQPELQKFGEAIADFFNSEWKKVGGDGYYKLYQAGDDLCGIGGFENGKGNKNQLVGEIESAEQKKIDDDFLFINNGEGNTSTSGGDDDDFLEYIAKAYGISEEYQGLIKDAQPIHLSFDGTHLKEITLKLKDVKQDVTIRFY